ncbi:MAG: NUDIX hydrolase [Tepidisphaeraceae bacterium]|jgi:ADP-ribose pyrophosphatase
MEITSRRTIYDSDWLRLHHVDVRLPDGTVARDWHLIDFPRQAAGIIPIGDDGRILMIDQRRFTTGRRSWETPGGRIEPGETPVQAARRELFEETGHTAESIEPIGSYFPSAGSSNQVFNLFLARGLRRAGHWTDTNEVTGIRWFSRDEIREMILKNEMQEGMTLTGLLWVMFREGVAGEAKAQL